MHGALAYFLTWTCHGTWVHGDDRGSVDRWHNVHATPTLPPHRGLEGHRRSRLKTAPIMLSTLARTIVERAIREECDFRDWTLLALNVRTNHVHCVVTAPEDRAESVMQKLKGRATRTLRRDGLIAPDQPVWTRHGSTRYCWTQIDVGRARLYVLDAQ